MNRVTQKVELTANCSPVVGLTNNQMPAYHPVLPFAHKSIQRSHGGLYRRYSSPFHRSRPAIYINDLHHGFNAIHSR